uniref:Cytochrome P450 315a1, mitochondrial n=2 Tax=Culex pipiens TaxID=7175 RepID=A0A8D8PF27_CULPI
MCNAAKPWLYVKRSIGSAVAGTKKGQIPFERLPGPWALPVLGPINDAVRLGNPKTLHLTVSNYHRKFGPIFRIKISQANAVFIKDPEMMRSVFVYEGKYPKHPLPESWTYFNQKHKCKRGLFFMDDEEWFKYRKLLNPLMMRDTDWMVLPIQRMCEKAVQSLSEGVTKDNPSYEIQNIESTLYKWSIEVILCLMLGNSYNTTNMAKLNTLVNDFSRTVHTIFQYSSELMMIPPQLADCLQLSAWKKFERLVPETLALANKIIDISLDDIERGDGLLSKMQDCIASRDDIKRIFADLIIAAGDTTSFSMIWCFYLLGRHQILQDQIRSGIYENFKSPHPLVIGTVREALRMFPVAPFIGRILKKDAVIGEYSIPKHTLVLLSLYSAGRDETNFHSPEEFLPQRWIRNNDQSCSFSPFKSHASLPFAIGSRSCIGRKIAQNQMHTLLAMVLKKYRLSVLNEQEIFPELKMITVPNEKLRLSLKKL